MRLAGRMLRSSCKAARAKVKSPLLPNVTSTSIVNTAARHVDLSKLELGGERLQNWLYYGLQLRFRVPIAIL